MSEVAAPSAAPTAATPSSTPSSTPSASAPEATTSSAPVSSTDAKIGGTPPPAETPAERKARVLKLKIDGVEREENLDEIPDEKLAYRLQMAEAAQKRMQEAAEEKKKIRDILEYMKKDPRKALADPALGIDLDKLVEERFAERYKEAMMTEEQKQTAALQRKIQEFEAREAERKAKEDAEAQAALEQKIQEEMTRDFNAALESSGLPKTRETLMMMAEIAKINLDHGVELTPAQMASEVKERLGGMHKNIVSGLKGDALIKYLGDDVVKEVIRVSVEKVKKSKEAAQPAVVPAPSVKIEKPTGNPNQDFRKFIRGF